MHFNDTDPTKREDLLGRLKELNHELSITRFHGMVELGRVNTN